MEKYDYFENVKDDVKEFIKDHYEYYDLNNDDAFDKLYDDLWTSDSVTGNGSGSYTFCAYTAEEYISHNWDLLQEALSEFGCDDINIIEKGAEWCDVTIRCYLLGGAIQKAIEELKQGV